MRFILILLLLLNPYVLAGVDQATLDRVNQYRTRHRALPVVWDTVIESSARNHAEYIADKGYLEHSVNNGYGENLAATYSANAMVDAVDMWYSEEPAYNYSQPGFSMATGHFTQLVWNASRRIGAAAVRGKTGMTFVVMQFAPPGNYLNAFKQNVFPPFSIPRPMSPPNSKAAPSYKPQTPSSSLLPPPSPVSTPSPVLVPSPVSSGHTTVPMMCWSRIVIGMAMLFIALC